MTRKGTGMQVMGSTRLSWKLRRLQRRLERDGMFVAADALRSYWQHPADGSPHIPRHRKLKIRWQAIVLYAICFWPFLLMGRSLNMPWYAAYGLTTICLVVTWAIITER